MKVLVTYNLYDIRPLGSLVTYLVRMLVIHRIWWQKCHQFITHLAIHGYENTSRKKECFRP